MAAGDQDEKEAVRFVAEAERLYATGALADAISVQRQAILLYASVLERFAPDSGVPQNGHENRLCRSRADACQQFGDYLSEAEQYPEAATIYQEAADLYRTLESSEAEAHACATKILHCAAALRARPQDRLYLLIAHYERQQQQWALQPDTQREQAECCLHIARIFQRRDRPYEAIHRLEEALQLYQQVEVASEVALACAECHHRIATIQGYTLGNFSVAAQHYRAAILLYEIFEPLVYGEQSARVLCELALADIEAEPTDPGRE